MKNTTFEESEVWGAFAEIAEREQLFTKQANFGLLPETLFDAPEGSELDVSITAVAGKHNELYGVTSETGEQLVGSAHPKNTKTELDNNKPKEKDLDVIETIVERQKVMRDIAEGTPKGKLASLVSHLSKLADVMDERGHTDLTAELDSMIERIAASGASGMNAAEVAQLGDQEYANEHNIPLDQAREERSRELGQLKQDVAEHTGANVGFNEPGTQEGAGQQVESHALSTLKERQADQIRQHNMKAQEMLGIPQTGVMDATFQKALSDRGIVPGSYRNWNQLYSMISASSPKSSLPDAGMESQTHLGPYKQRPTSPASPVYRGDAAHNPLPPA